LARFAPPLAGADFSRSTRGKEAGLLVPAASYHPFRAGMAGIANVIYRQLT
jgi:hypothetical protein